MKITKSAKRAFLFENARRAFMALDFANGYKADLLIEDDLPQITENALEDFVMGCHSYFYFLEHGYTGEGIPTDE